MNGTLLAATIPVFLIVATGFVMRWRDWMPANLDTGLMRLGLVLLTPCLILDKVIGDPALNDPSNVILALGLGFGLVVLSLLLSLLLAPALGLSKGTGKRTFALSCALQNYGYLAIPVLVALFGDQPLGVLFLFGMGVELAVWTAGVMTLQGFSGSSWRALINGPSLAVFFGLAFHYSGGDHWIPGFIQTTWASLGQCAVPMALFSIGATIAAETKHTSWSFHPGTLAGAVLCRLVLFPALILTLAAVLPTSPELRMVMLVQASMPSAVVSIILAKLYGGHPLTAIQVILLTTLLSIFTMPLVIPLGRRWLDL